MAKRKRRRNDGDSPGLFHGLYDTVTGAPSELTHGVLDEADYLLGTGPKKAKTNRERFDPKRAAKRAGIRSRSMDLKYRGKGSKAWKRIKTQASRKRRRMSHTEHEGSPRFRVKDASRLPNRISKISTLKGRKMTTLQMVRAKPKKARSVVSEMLRASKLNPGSKHLKGDIPEKYQRMYEDIASDPRAKKKYGARVKEVAARTALSHYAKGNPSGWAKLLKGLGIETNQAYFFSARKHKRRVLKGLAAKARAKKKALRNAGRIRTASKRTKRGKRIEAAIGRRKKHVARSRYHGVLPVGGSSLGGGFRITGPSRLPNNGTFNEFRGRPSKSEYSMKVADGTPAHTKEAGGLEEMKVGSRLMRFNPSKARLLYKGNKLYIGGVRLATRAHKNPGEEIDMGPVHTVVYHADKPHLGEPRRVPYEHKFGDEGGKKPHLICDPEGYPYFEGGSYRISPDGIIN